jgi:hypothetical protein
LPSGRIFDEISRLLPQQGISGADHANGAKSACSPFSRRSAPPFLAFRCDLGVSYTLLTGDRGFESFSLQQRVRLSQEPIFVGQEPRLSARVCPAAFPVRSTESRRARQHRTNPQQYLCRAIFQYRISGDAVATSYRVKVARPVPKPGRASSRLRDAGGSCELGSGSSKAERGPLIVPA